MRIHHIIASINQDIGGPAISTTRLSRSLNQTGVLSQIHSIDYTRHGPLSDLDAGPFIRAGWFTEITRGWNQRFHGRTRKLIRSNPGIIHNHGCWMAPNYLARRLANELSLPLLTSPRGMLEPWSMGFHSNIKKWAWWLYEKQNLQCADAFHATSAAEVESIRNLGFRQPIYLIPNGVEITPPPAECPQELEVIKQPFVLFLSRIHPKKGLDILLRSWDELKGRHPEWSLVVAGPDLEHYRTKLETTFPGSNQLHWIGPATGRSKDWLLANASLLCLPTHSENFGIVIAEALAHGTPVLTTDQTPWKVISEKQCGWVTKPDQKELTVSLANAISTPPGQLSEMGTYASRWMKQDFNWSSIAESMCQAYAHLSGSGPAPHFLLDV